MSLRNLEVKPGDLIWPKWQALLRWAKSRRFIRKPGLRFRETSNGIEVIVERSIRYPHPFRVSLAGADFRVSEGTLDGEMVAIGDKYLDGSDVKTGSPGSAPLLPVGKVPSKNVVSWVALYRRESPEKPARIEHLTKRDPKAQPLALVHWSGSTGRLRQIVRHHLASGTSGERVFFWGV
jgi:hypothetical protein